MDRWRSPRRRCRWKLDKLVLAVASCVVFFRPLTNADKRGQLQRLDFPTLPHKRSAFFSVIPRPKTNGDLDVFGNPWQGH
jgi:hypothetical protein